MNKKQQAGFKQKKRWVMARWLGVLLTGVFLLSAGHVVWAFILIALLFIYSELFLADHNFYDPKNDYQYEFETADRVTPKWLDDGSGFSCGWEHGNYDTALLSIRVKYKFLGKFLDPFVIITSGSIVRKQYFERSVDGLRYINISEFIASDTMLSVETNYCNLLNESSEVLLFSNPSLENKKILVIAPHSDDAEIAAFGLYSTHKSAVITITAGEVGPQAFQSSYSSSEQASLLKGRLRAWESIAVPLWAGVKKQDVIQLGYFCLCLKDMHEAPADAIASKTAGVSDTRVFRTFNEASLKSDKHGKSSWETLVTDLIECVDRLKPDIIITPHLQLDPHQDHHYSTLAVKEALVNTQHRPTDIYGYANHLVYSDMFPFGPVHTLASMPPNIDKGLKIDSVVSMPLSLSLQKDKAAALSMMHDLQTPLRWKKRLRFALQARLIGRPLSPYGADEYFRKAIRSNELFFRQTTKNFLD